MRTDLFDFELPRGAHCVASAASDAMTPGCWSYGPAPARSSRIVCVRDLPDLLAPGDALVVNDTKVIAARLTGRRIGRGEANREIEATLHRGSTARAGAPSSSPPSGSRRATSSGSATRAGCASSASSTPPWRKRARAGRSRSPSRSTDRCSTRRSTSAAHMPLPPYIAARRAPDERDRADYQTMFAQAEGSVAAPTAGLHFTDALLARLAERGIALHKVTLHVGAGTFLPVKAADTAGHRMHPE